MDTSITVEVVINAPIATVWDAFTTPADIKRWSAISDDAQMTECTVDLREGGKFFVRTQNKAGHPGSTFEGKFTKVVPFNAIELSSGERKASVQFDTWGVDNVAVTVVFDAESESSIEQEQQVALSILQSFSRYVQPEN
ncbi:MAG TPA: SRPBCC domain-containing protein [Burkholderiaceae bacterium]|nr:SRPBCC domain-containing protein [Burkholderiaceae bacterium]